MERDILKLEDFKDKLNKDSWLPTSKKTNNKQQDALDQVCRVMIGREGGKPKAAYLGKKEGEVKSN